MQDSVPHREQKRDIPFGGGFVESAQIAQPLPLMRLYLEQPEKVNLYITEICHRFLYILPKISFRPPLCEKLQNFFRFLALICEIFFISPPKRFDFPGESHYNTLIITLLREATYAFTDPTRKS